MRDAQYKKTTVLRSESIIDVTPLVLSDHMTTTKISLTSIKQRRKSMKK